MSEERESLIPKENSQYGTYSTNDSIINHRSTNSTPDNPIPSTSQNADSDLPSISTAPASQPADQMRSTLSFFNKIGYGLGHVYNDLCAGVWFSYTLLFMQGALLMPAAEAGALMMLGQVNMN